MRVVSFLRRANVLSLPCLAFLMAFSANSLRPQPATTITIRVMDSKTGLPVKQGDLHFTLWATKEYPETISYSPDRMLWGVQTGVGLGEVTIPGGLNYIRAWVSFGSTNWGMVSCDVTKGNPHPMPIYSVAQILETGILAPNLCSQRTTSAKPGEFVLFVRKMTFWEGMRN